MKWKFPNGVEMTFGEYLEKTETSNELKEPSKGPKIQKVLDQKLDAPAKRKGVAEPTAKPSSAERLKAFRKGGK